jgi:hypothetical protein
MNACNLRPIPQIMESLASAGHARIEYEEQGNGNQLRLRHLNMQVSAFEEELALVRQLQSSMMSSIVGNNQNPRDD